MIGERVTACTSGSNRSGVAVGPLDSIGLLKLPLTLGGHDFTYGGSTGDAAQRSLSLRGSPYRGYRPRALVLDCVRLGRRGLHRARLGRRKAPRRGRRLYVVDRSTPGGRGSDRFSTRSHALDRGRPRPGYRLALLNGSFDDGSFGFFVGRVGRDDRDTLPVRAGGFVAHAAGAAISFKPLRLASALTWDEFPLCPG